MIKSKRIRSMPQYKPRLDLWDNPNYRLSLKEKILWFLAVVLVYKGLAFLFNAPHKPQEPRRPSKTHVLALRD